MKLDELYSLRRRFTIIGLSGRMGAGCTRIAEALSSDFSELKTEIRSPDQFDDNVFSRKYRTAYDFVSHGDNWQKFTIIRYKDVIIFYILSMYGNDPERIRNLIEKEFRIFQKEDNSYVVKKIMGLFREIKTKFPDLIDRITEFNGFFTYVKDKEQLEKLHAAYFSPDYRDLSERISYVLQKIDYEKRSYFLHRIACNIRKCGDPLGYQENDIKNINNIAHLINRLIKSLKQTNGQKPTKVVIDSLRNSLEIMFFKERYSAFYMIAMKDVDNKAKSRIEDRLEEYETDKSERRRIVNSLIHLDEIEYRCKDFRKGKFSSPDVENCIQKSDIHILNRKTGSLEDKSTPEFYSREEQLLKIISLIHQPGLISPTAEERCMQIAHTSKLNSGCISRQVGAVVTDDTFSIKSVGWNDVPKGTTPCKLRSYEEFRNEGEKPLNDHHFSDFELSTEEGIEKTSYKYKGKSPGNFKEAINLYFETSYESKSDDLNGKKCSFCFKTIHNFYEGENNQVHTKSLHAEENAMLQISKNGGEPLKDGFLFTTASPCELCAKKAFQLGIKKVFYIDPYPGISLSQIISNGKREDKPKLVPFKGVIGKSYEKLYEPFMSYKDEVSMMLDLKPIPRKDVLVHKINDSSGNTTLQKALRDKKVTDDDIIKLIEKEYLN